ncbi:MAG: DUF2249 domain-containing protein [Bacteroidetes bacterium]|nr:DUF2249 domain-containing protein [Bacteroidota bacterium]
MNISANTKISSLIKANPASIEAIVSINKHFEKLRNPVLRKILAPRITITDAAKIGGCTVNDFFNKLIPLGFVVLRDVAPGTNNVLPTNERPAFMQGIDAKNIITLDVRPDLASGKDPFQKIMQVVSSFFPGNVLLIINTFEPLPLINILTKRGFEYYTEVPESGITYTWLKRTNDRDIGGAKDMQVVHSTKDDFRIIADKYKHKMKVVDVRDLEMPLPMITILQELELLPDGHVLFVNHKKIPQFLLPELKEKKFSWVIDEAGEGDIKLLIFR